MSRLPLTATLIAALSLPVALVSRSAEASVVEALDLETLVREADQVVLARVIKHWSQYDDRGRIVTDYQMQVERAEKGDAAPGSAVIVRRLGGIVEGRGMHVEGEPGFQDGELVLVFGLRGQQTYMRPIGMGQGAMRIFEQNGERWVRSDASGMALVSRSGRGDKARVAVPEPRRLDDLLATVRTLASKK